MAWRYTCNIPTHITGKDENGEPVVLYRVNVHFQWLHDDRKADNSGGTPAESAPFFVLRRYSQFRHLYDQLKASVPTVMAARGMAPPPKHPLVLGDKRDALERRRLELERWLWRLIGTAELARAPQLKTFLEFEKALARAQQQQARRLLERERLLDGASLLTQGSGPDYVRGCSPSTTPSEAGFAVAASGRHLSYPGGAGGGGSVMGDDSASDASGPSVAASAVRPPSSVVAGWAADGSTAATGGVSELMPAPPYTGRPSPDPRVAAASGEQERATAHQQQQPQYHHHHHKPRQAAGPSGAFSTSAASAAPATVNGDAAAAAGSEAPSALARLGIHLQNRGDVRRLVDLLVQRLETACSDAAAAAGEAQLLRDANRAMAERLGELELERAGEGPAAEIRARLVAVEAARASLEQRVEHLNETLVGRTAAHTAQVAQLQAQLTESREENAELLARLREWDVGGSAATAAAAITTEAMERASQLQQQVEDLRKRAETEAARAEAARAETQTARAEAEAAVQRAGELQQRTVEAGAEAEAARTQAQAAETEAGSFRRQVEELQGRLRYHEQQLADERKRREQAEAAVARPPPAPAPAQQPQALLDRARADNALLAQEVQRLRAAMAQEREAARAAAAAAAQQVAALQARLREAEAGAGGAGAGVVGPESGPMQARGQGQAAQA